VTRRLRRRVAGAALTAARQCFFCRAFPGIVAARFVSGMRDVD
jgi:hypothetical protein